MVEPGRSHEGQGLRRVDRDENGARRSAASDKTIGNGCNETEHDRSRFLRRGVAAGLLLGFSVRDDNIRKQLNAPKQHYVPAETDDERETSGRGAVCQYVLRRSENEEEPVFVQELPPVE